MNFDALPYDIFRRVATCLDRRDISTLSSTDMKRAVLSFCLWERTEVAKGGGYSPPNCERGDGGGRSVRGAAAGYAEDCGGPLGAPIYRFLSPSDSGRDHSGEAQCDGQGGAVAACDAKTVLASYPRSGNSLLRRLLEEVTGIITGSDTRPDRTLSRSLSVFGMQGEGVVDHRVQVVKTHYPERTGFRSFKADKAILLVRNPFDAVDSYFNMALTNTHDQSLHDSVYEEFREFWDGMIRNEFKVWERFHVHWLSSTVPVRVVRYEDLLAEPVRALTEVVAFIHGISTTEASETFGERIRRAPAVVKAGQHKGSEAPTATTTNTNTNHNGNNRRCSSLSDHDGINGGGREGREGCGGKANGGAAAASVSAGTGLYQPRTSGRGVGGSLGRRFSVDQVAWCVRETGALLRRFGYDPLSQGFPPALGAELLELNLLQSLYSTAADGSGAAASGAVGMGTGTGNGVEGETRAPPKNEGGVAQGQPSNKVVATKPTVTVNDRKASGPGSGAGGGGLRGERDAYGRAMTPFRRSHTQRDTRPLPLRGEDRKAEEWRLRRRQVEKEANSRNSSSSQQQPAAAVAARKSKAAVVTAMGAGGVRFQDPAPTRGQANVYS